MDSFSDKLKTVLADPEAMEKIVSIAKGFAGNSDNMQPPEKTEDSGKALQGEAEHSSASFSGENPAKELMRSPAIAQALRLLNDGSRERVALLQAMRPFVREEKKEKLDHIIQTMKLLDLLSSAQSLL